MLHVGCWDCLPGNMGWGCTGRAAEELLYGEDEMSTINQRRLIMARRIATKLVVSSAMTENPVIGPRTLTVPVDLGDSSLFQIVNKRASLLLSAPGHPHRATWIALKAI